MPAVPLKAGESALQCCCKCGGHLPPQRLPLRHIVSRTFHTSTRPQDERGPHERVLHFGRKDGSPAGQAPLAGKIDMAKKFRLATTTGKDQPIQPIVLKNYEEKKHGRKRQKLVTEVGQEAQLPSTTELLRSAEEAAEHSQEDVNMEIDAIKDKVLEGDKLLRLQARRLAAQRAGLQNEIVLRPRGQPDLAIPAPNVNVILLDTYLRWQRQLSDMFDADQLLAYTKHFLAQIRQDPRFHGVRSVEDFARSGQALHQGWRPMGKDFKRILDYRSRSRKGISDRIIRWLWQYEIEEEIQSYGKLFISVDEEISPFFVKSRHATVLPFLGASPTVSIGLSSDGRIIEIVGPKYECFENERTIRQRMADLSVVQLHTQDFRHHPKEAQPLRIKRKTSVDHVLPVDVVETIAQAHGCVSLNHDAEMIKIIGPNSIATEDCKHALFSAFMLPFRGSYSITTGGNETNSTLCLDHEATQYLPWIKRQRPLGRFVAATPIQAHMQQHAATDIDVEGLAADFARVKDLTSTTQFNLQPPHEGLLNWTAQSSLTTEIGKILHPMQDVSRLKPRTGEQSAAYRRKPLNFAPTLQGLPQLLAVTLRQPPLWSNSNNHVRLTFAGKPTSPLISTSKSIPFLEVDLRPKGSVVTILAARLVLNTNVMDIMLPSLSLDVRFTRNDVLELSDPQDNLKLVEAAGNLQYTEERWSSDWLLNLKIPTSALIDERGSRIIRQSEPDTESESATIHDEAKELIDVHYAPVNLERIQTISFPFRKHILDITHVNSGHFGVNAEQIRLRKATPEEQKEVFRTVDSDAAKGFSPLTASQTSPPASTDEDAGAPITVDDTSSGSPKETGYLEAVAHLVRRLGRGVGNMDFIGLDLSRAPKAVRQTQNQTQ